MNGRLAACVLACFRYEDWVDGSDGVPRVGDYGWMVRDTPIGQYAAPFEIVLEETTGLPVLLLKRNVDACPEDAVDDADDCVYASLLQLHLDGWTFAHTGMRCEPCGETRKNV